MSRGFVFIDSANDAHAPLAMQSGAQDEPQAIRRFRGAPFRPIKAGGAPPGGRRIPAGTLTLTRPRRD